jgi:hypothetical protein
LLFGLAVVVAVVVVWFCSSSRTHSLSHSLAHSASCRVPRFG